MLIAIRRAIHEIVEDGAVSAAISTGTGSKSYTRLDLDKLQKMEADYAQRVNLERNHRSRGALGYRRVRPDFGRV